MKKYSLYIFILSLISLFTACTDESFVGDINEKGLVQVRVFATTPDLIDNSIESKAAYDGPFDNEGKVQSLAVMVFENATPDAKLLQLSNATMTNDTDGKVTLSAQQNVHLRLVANSNLAGVSKGQKWSDIRSMLEYTVDNSTTQKFPMIGELPGFNINSSTSIGTSTNRVKLTRAMAKLTINVKSHGAFEYEGNKVFQIVDRGYVFAQTTPDNLESPVGAQYTDEAGAYNTRTVTYSPARKNTGADSNTPLENRTYIIIKGKYSKMNDLAGTPVIIESYYRIDLATNDDGNKLKYVDFQRNHNYLIDVTVKGVGYATEAEAKKYPINNSDLVDVTITESSAYEFLIDQTGRYLGVSNSVAVIYGKSAYVPNGYAGTPKPYEYILTTINTEKTIGLKPEDISIDDAGLISNAQIKVVDRYDIDGNPILIDGVQAQEYILTGTLQNMSPFGGDEKTITFVTIRSGRLVKNITVQMREFLDCTYGFEGLTFNGNSAMMSCYIRKHRKVDNNFGEYPNWMMFSLGNGGNPKVEDIGNFDNHNVIANYDEDIYFQYKENVKPNIIGIYSDKAINEGYRFSDIYLTAPEGLTLKVVAAQACAELVGFFGNSLYDHTDDNSYDDGGNYDSYLLVQRRDEHYSFEGFPANNTNLWYRMTERQLYAMWLTNNSDSRKTSPISFNAEMGGPFTSLASEYRQDYSKEQKDYYAATKRWSGTWRNADSEVLDFSMRGRVLNFSNGEISRVSLYNSPTVEIKYRDVRNLTYDELPDEIKAKLGNKKPVEGNQVTIDPAGYLSDDYFSPDANGANALSRKIEVLQKTTETTSTKVYTYSESATNKWETTDESLEKEYTLTEAWNKAKEQGGRLPTQREALMLYIYEPLVNSTVGSFNKEEKDGYYDPTGTEETSDEPNRLFYKMLRYPSADSDPYLYWYWTSTTTNGEFNGTDSGVEPYRINFVHGDVSYRGASEATAKDHYRAVKTVE